MKKRISYLTMAMLAFFTAGVITACKDKPNDETKLPRVSAPTNLTADFWDLTWEGVEGITQYAVRVTSDEGTKTVLEETQTTETEFDLYPYLSPGTSYTVEVKSCGNGETTGDSAWSGIEYTTEAVTDAKYLDLWYIKESNSYGVSVTEDLEGEIVLPDTYKNKPITHVGTIGSINAEERLFTALRLPLGTEEIGFYSCRNSTALTEIKLPKGLKKIVSRAFENCPRLVVIPSPEIDDETLEIGESVFKGTGLLSDKNDWVRIGGILCNYSGTLKGEVRLEKPENVTRVLDRLLAEQDELEKVTISGNWGELPSSMFERCDKLTEVTMEEGITKVGSGAFNGCRALQRVDIPETVTEMGSRVFWSCKGLTQITLPSGLTEISQGLFSDCSSLQSITIPSKVKIIKSSAFSGCTSLSEIHLPEGLTTLDGSVFSELSSLKSIKLPSTLRGKFSITNSAIRTIEIPEGVTEICVNGCADLTEIIIPSTVEVLNLAFCDCVSLKSVQLPMGLKRIHIHSFLNCGMEEVVIPATVNWIAHNAFSDGEFIDKYYPSTVVNQVQRIFYHGADLQEFESIFYYDISLSGTYPNTVSLPLYFYSHSEPPKTKDGKAYDGNYWRYVDGVPTIWQIEGEEQPTKMYACHPQWD